MTPSQEIFPWQPLQPVPEAPSPLLPSADVIAMLWRGMPFHRRDDSLISDLFANNTEMPAQIASFSYTKLCSSEDLAPPEDVPFSQECKERLPRLICRLYFRALDKKGSPVKKAAEQFAAELPDILYSTDFFRLYSFILKFLTENHPESQNRAGFENLLRDFAESEFPQEADGRIEEVAFLRSLLRELTQISQHLLLLQPTATPNRRFDSPPLIKQIHFFLNFAPQNPGFSEARLHLPTILSRLYYYKQFPLKELQGLLQNRLMTFL